MTTSIVPAMKRNLLDAATYVVERIRACGCDLHGFSRFGTMQGVLSRGTLTPADPDFNVAIESVRDARIMEFVFDQLEGYLPDDVLREKVHKAVHDSTLPEHDRQKSRGRDAQLEMYVAAICRKAGTAPTFEEPDVRCSVDGCRYGLAIKRVKNETQLEKRIRKAAGQIEDAGLPGQIILDVSFAFNLDNERLINVHDDALTRAQRLASTRFGDDYFFKIKEWIRDRKVDSVVLIDHVVRQHPDDGWGLDSLTFFIPLVAGGDRRFEAFEVFQDCFLAGLATPAEG